MSKRVSHHQEVETTTHSLPTGGGLHQQYYLAHYGNLSDPNPWCPTL